MTTILEEAGSADPVARDTFAHGDRAPSGLRPRLVVEMPLAIMTACCVSLGLQWIVTRLNIPMPSYAPLALVSLSSVGLLGVAVWLMSRRRWPRWATPLSWSGIAALGTLPLALFLQNTPFYLLGISGDQFFRTQYLQRLTESIALADGNYANIPPFYPAGWFWIGGRFANLIDMPAWAAYKPYAILTMAVAPVIAFVLWSRITRRGVAVLLAVLTCVLGLRVFAYEPYSWVLVAAIVPGSVLAWRGFRAAVLEGRRDWSAVGITGALLGVCGAVYTLLFGFLCMVLVVLALAAFGQWWRRARASQDGVARSETLAAARRAVGHLLRAGLVALPLLLLVWTPFLLHVLDTGVLPSGAARRFLPRVGAVWPAPMFELSVLGAIYLAGTVWIVLCWRRRELARVLGVVVLCCYGWYLCSFLALGMETTLLAFRVDPVLRVALLCAGGVAVFDLLHWISTRRFPQAGRPVGTVFAVVGLVALVSLTQTVRDAEQDALGGVFDHAYRTYTPAGETALGASDPNADGAWNDELLAALDEMARGQADEHVMLTTYHDLLAFRPYWGFQTTVEHYANPLADFDRRRQLIKSWADSEGPRELIDKLDSSPYAPPDVFVFRRGSDGLHMSVSHDVFPREPNNTVSDVVFPARLFDSAQFERRDVGPFTVIVRR